MVARIALTCASHLVLTCLCGALPSSRWGGAPSPNMVSPATGLPADLTTCAGLWTLEVGTHQYSIPTIDGNEVFVGSNDGTCARPGLKPTGGGVLRCVHRHTGRLIWQFVAPRFFEGMEPPYHFNQWKCGFCSGPVVEGDRVYVVSPRGEILCLDRKGLADGNDGPFTAERAYMGLKRRSQLLPTDGDIIWCYDLIKELDVVPHDVCGSTLLLSGPFLYACTSNGVDGSHRVVPKPQAPSLIVLAKDTGRLVAREREGIGTRILHGQWSSPSLGHVNGKTLIFFGGGDGILYAFEEPDTGRHSVQSLKKVWSYDCNPPDYRFRNGTPIPYARWNRKSPEGPSEIIGTPVFYRDKVYVAIGQSPLHGPGKGQLSCVNAQTGKPIWTSRLVDRSLATVSIAEGLLFVVDFSGKLHCFEAERGKRLWYHDLGRGAWPASTFVADGKVYASTEGKVLWVFRASREKRLLSKRRFSTPPITCTASEGTLYVPTQKRLYAFRGR